MGIEPLRAPRFPARTKAALFVLTAVVIAVIVGASNGMWLTRTSAERLADDGVNTTGTPTGEICSFEVRKYRGSYTQYAAIYAYTVNGRRYEVKGAARFGEVADVTTDATGVEVRYLPEKPTEAIAHDERIQRTPNESQTTPKVTTDC
ncbi:hypothetical protein QUG92_16450 [Curtobacterium sp. RHCKG23]|uniref:DUF3592 domain-containing protein n=1 Tax=Curtobacterium citri TaxID=3055139 RepID=A0ABT7TAW3_9MICO|nr:DUF3592 domain-containing protein [Curtobacterium citri]MDM7886701.1 hypothetical protein [Curtobacterium citri]